MCSKREEKYPLRERWSSFLGMTSKKEKSIWARPRSRKGVSSEMSKLQAGAVVRWGHLKNQKCTKVNYIPHICHFFYTSKIFGEQNLHRKNAQITTKYTENCHFLRYYGKIHSKLPIFCVKSVKIYTNIFVAFVTNIRYASTQNH